MSLRQLILCLQRDLANVFPKVLVNDIGLYAMKTEEEVANELFQPSDQAYEFEFRVHIHQVSPIVCNLCDIENCTLFFDHDWMSMIVEMHIESSSEMRLCFMAKGISTKLKLHTQENLWMELQNSNHLFWFKLAIPLRNAIEKKIHYHQFLYLDAKKKLRVK